MAELTEVASVEKLIAWPTPQDYNEAIQAPSLCFKDEALRVGNPVLNEFGLPRPISGGFASVYRIQSQQSDHAVRCFLSRLVDRERRYAAIGEFLSAQAPPWAVRTEFQSEGMLIGSTWYPIVKMDWVKGNTLGAWIEAHLDRPDDLRSMHDKLRQVVLDLNRLGVAHGDLQPANIIVLANNEIKLVDYDGMFVPELAGWEANELGHKNFQHHGRQPDHFNKNLDFFSARLILSALEILSHAPELWDTLKCADEALLWRQPDLLDPDHSYAFSILESHEDSEVVRVAREFRAVARGPLSHVPPLMQRIAAVEEELPEVVYVPVEPPVQPIRVPPARKPQRKKKKTRNRYPFSGPVSTQLLVNIARDLHSTNRMFLYPTFAAIMVFLTLSAGLYLWRMGTFYPLINALRPQGQVLFEEAETAFARADEMGAELKYNDILSRFDKGEMNFGLHVGHLVEVLAHKGELCLKSGRMQQARIYLDRAAALATNAPPAGDDYEVYKPPYFAHRLALCDAKDGKLDKAAEVLIGVYGKDGSLSDEFPKETNELVSKLIDSNLGLALDLWKKWYLTRVEYDSGAIGFAEQMEFPMFQHAARFMRNGDHAKARQVYETLAKAYEEREQATDQMNALGGVYYSFVHEKKMKEAAQIATRLRALDDRLIDADIEQYGKEMPQLPVIGLKY